MPGRVRADRGDERRRRRRRVLARRRDGAAVGRTRYSRHDETATDRPTGHLLLAGMQPGSLLDRPS